MIAPPKRIGKALCLVPFFGGVLSDRKVLNWQCVFLSSPFLFRYFSQLPEGVQIVYIYASDPIFVSQIEMFADI